MRETLTPPEFPVEEGGERVGDMSEVSAAGVIPEVEVPEKAVRRQVSAAYKRTILTAADACTREAARAASRGTRGAASASASARYAASDAGTVCRSSQILGRSTSCG